jgi:hypothetical protein
MGVVPRPLIFARVHPVERLASSAREVMPRTVRIGEERRRWTDACPGTIIRPGKVWTADASLPHLL